MGLSDTEPLFYDPVRHDHLINHTGDQEKTLFPDIGRHFVSYCGFSRLPSLFLKLYFRASMYQSKLDDHRFTPASSRRRNFVLRKKGQ